MSSLLTRCQSTSTSDYQRRGSLPGDGDRPSDRQQGDLLPRGPTASGNAYDAIGGLTDGAVYTVTLDAARPGWVTLTDSNGNAVSSLDASAATGNSQSFVLLDPTRVKLATTFQNAAADVPVTIALSQPTVAGPGHSLTPQSASAAVTFDPSTDLECDRRDDLRWAGQRPLHRRGGDLHESRRAVSDDLGNRRRRQPCPIDGRQRRPHRSRGRHIERRRHEHDGGIHRKRPIECSTRRPSTWPALTVSASHTAQFDSQANSLEASLVGGSGASGYECHHHDRGRLDRRLHNRHDPVIST